MFWNALMRSYAAEISQCFMLFVILFNVTCVVVYEILEETLMQLT